MEDVSDEPLIVEAEVEGYLVRRIYVDRGASVEVMFEHYFENLSPAIKARLKETQTDLVGFVEEATKPLGKIELEVCFGSEGLCRRTMMKFTIIKAPSPDNVILGRSDLRTLRAIPYPFNDEVPHSERHCHHGHPVSSHIEMQAVRKEIGEGMLETYKAQLKLLLKDNMDIFSWEPADMTGVPRRIIEHNLNVNTSIEPEWARYQQLIDSTFQSQIERNLAYVDDMVIKTNNEKRLLADVVEIFDNLRKINMKPNPNKCSFKVENGKFLGYMVTSKGIRANPKKTRVLADLQSPRTLKEMQSLAGKLAALNSLSEDEELHRKPSVPYPFVPKRNFVRIPGGIQGGGKLCSTHRLERTHRSKRKTKSHPLRQLHSKRSGKKLCSDGKFGIVTGAHDNEVEAVFRSTFGEGAYNITFEPRNAMKGQVLADIITETPDDELPEKYLWTPKVAPERDDTEEWTLFTNRASSLKGSGLGLVLIGPGGVEHTYAFRLTFDSTRGMNIQKLEARVDSKLVASQINGNYVARSDSMMKYLAKAKEYIACFKSFSIKNIPRNQNQKADVLSKLASVSFNHLTNEVLVEVLNERSTEGKEINTVVEEEGDNWMTPIIQCLKKGGYYWPTMHEDAKKEIQKCDSCQIHLAVPKLPKTFMTSIMAPWPFYQCGTDILGPLPQAAERVKYVIVAINYFIKWIEPKPLAKITGKDVIRFVLDNIICRVEDQGKLGPEWEGPYRVAKAYQNGSYKLQTIEDKEEGEIFQKALMYENIGPHQTARYLRKDHRTKAKRAQP
nr:hypothetical protein [Tanacetum cinerariifolium]